MHRNPTLIVMPRWGEEAFLISSIKKYVLKKHKCLATYQGEKLVIVLVGLGATPNLPKYVATARSSITDWSKNLPSQPGYTYAHRQSFMEYYPDKAWVGAEHRT